MVKINKPIQVIIWCLGFTREFIIAILLVTVFWIAKDNRTYSNKTAREWHNLFAEQKMEETLLLKEKSEVFGKLLQLEQCVDKFDNASYTVRNGTTVKAFCILERFNEGKQ